MRKAKWFAPVGMILAIAVLVPAARADQISVCQSVAVCPGTGPNVITNINSFIVFDQGSFTLQNPLLVIVGVYNGIGAPSISFNGVSAEPAATVGTYGLTANTATLVSGQDAFAQLGLSAGGSESFTNWSAGDTANGFAAPTSFKLYAFALPTNLTSGGITIDESGAPNGSYVIAYDCKDGTGSNTTAAGAGGCSTQGNVSQTVFTNTGLIHSTTVPEPRSLALLGLGMVGLLGLRRKQVPA